MTNPVDNLVRQTIERWQTQLLQIDRRNRLLYLKADRASIPISEVEPDAFVSSLSASRRGLAFDYAERNGTTAGPILGGSIITRPLEVLDLQRRLKALRAKDREFTEEQGVNVLFLAAGFLNWVDGDGELARAPLVLFACDLEVASPRVPYYLKREDEDPIINNTLRYVLQKDHGVVLPEIDPDLPIAAYLDLVRRTIRSKPDWSVSPDLLLSTFQFSKVAMWEDLERLKAEEVESQLVRALAGDPSAMAEMAPPLDPVPAMEELRGGRLDDILDVRNQFLVLEADHSQLLAIESARNGRHLVIHGPPGTGKSQTIANLIATLIADGKRVLFVSEKTAALDVVKRRLDECQLGILCLDLHSERGKKSSFYGQLRASLASRRPVDGDSFDFSQLLAVRGRLNALTRALHDPREPLGLSVYAVHGRYAHLQSLPDLDWEVQEPKTLTRQLRNELRGKAANVAQYPEEFRELSTSPLRGLRHSVGQLSATDAVRRSTALVEPAVMEIRRTAGEVARELQFPVPASPADVKSLAAALAHLGRTPGVPESWLKADRVARLREIAVAQEKDQRSWREGTATLAAGFGRILGDIDYDRLFGLRSALTVDAETAQRALGNDWRKRLVSDGIGIATAAAALPGNVDRVRAAFDALRSLLGVNFGDRRSEASRLVAVAKDLAAILPLPESWFGDGAIEWRIELSTREAEAELNLLRDSEEKLGREFDSSLVDQVTTDMLVRFRTDYQSSLRRLLPGYRRDLRILRGAKRSGAKLSYTEARTALEVALDVKSRSTSWAARTAALQQELGDRFHDRQTDWEGVRTQAAIVKNLVAERDSTLETLRSLNNPAGRDRLRDAAAALAAHLGALEDCEAAILVVPVDARAEFGAAVAMVTPLAQAINAAGEAVGELQPAVSHLPTDIDELLVCAKVGLSLDRLEREMQLRESALATDFDHFFSGWDTDWNAISAALAWTEELINLLPHRLPEPVLTAVSNGMRTRMDEISGKLQRALREYSVALAPLDPVFDPALLSWRSWDEPDFETLREWAAEAALRAESAPTWLGFALACDSLAQATAPTIVERARSRTDDVQMLPDMVERRLLQTWLTEFHASLPELKGFATSGQEARVEEFRKLDKQSMIASRRSVRKRAFDKYPDRFITHTNAGELAQVQAQLSRQRNQLPVRKLLAKAPTAIQQIKPCFMMSPLAVSQYLERGLATGRVTFDTVIFDEASQVFPEDAVPAIARAKQVIVVGDQKQLPPTSFFRKLDGEQEEFGRGDDPEDDTNSLEGRESILGAMLGTVAGGNQCYLDVHYRSRHEDLIRFSNNRFYEDRLLCFPSPAPADEQLGISSIYVDDGTYEAGASRTNRREAERVVDRVFDLMRSCPLGETIGVVALSRAQAGLIEALIDQRRMLERDVDARFADDGAERFFVKNLENVQGDERDHIIFSVGYGPVVKDGAVPQRFGPINNDQGGDPSYGQRRLNVAITRARRSFTVVHSLLPGQITATSKGAQTLRRFLEFAMNPRTALTAVQSFDPAADFESGFEEAVGRALRQRGWEVQPQVGVAGYRIDLGVWSTDRSRFLLGVECDGWTYHSSVAARDRDWLRQQILEQLGWRIVRVWSTAWARDPSAELDRIETALRESAASPAFASNNFEARGPLDDSSGSAESLPRQEHLFPLYEITNLPRQAAELKYATLRSLKPLIQGVVEKEGPIKGDLLLMRIRDAFIGRITEAARETVFSAVHDLVVREKSISRSGADTNDDAFYSVPSRPAIPRRNSSKASRSSEQIPNAELEVGVVMVARVLGASTPTDLAKETGRQFGVAHVRSEFLGRIEGAIESVCRQAKLKMTSDGLLVPGDANPT